MSFLTSAGGRGLFGRSYGPVITYPATVNHSATVIMLHGLGDTGNGWAPVAPEMRLPHVKWMFPTAPTRPISVNMGMEMPGWFDIDHLDEASFMRMMKGDHGFDPDGTEESVKYIVDLIEQEVQSGIPMNRIVLGGFSQGGHIALKALFHKELTLAGCLALSTWLEPQKGQAPQSAFKIPIFYGHGGSDPLIPPVVAQSSVSYMEKQGMNNLKFQMYPGMQHSTCPQEISDIKNVLEKWIPHTKVSESDIDSMSIKQLKEFLKSNGVDPTKYLEKTELVSKAKSIL